MNISIFGFSGVIFVLFITKFVLIVYNSIAICDTYYFSPFHCTHCLCQHGKWYCKTFPIGNISAGIVFSLILPYQTLPQNSSKKSSCCERKSCIRYYLDCHTQTERLVEKQNAQLIGSSNVGSNSLLNSHQSAYCKHHSTETALLYIHDYLISAMGSQKISCLCLLDLSAAFDTIDHDILIRDRWIMRKNFANYAQRFYRLCAHFLPIMRTFFNSNFNQSRTEIEILCQHVNNDVSSELPTISK